MNKLNILYEDNHIIVVIKPAGILSQSDITDTLDMLSLIKTYLKEKYQKPGNVYLGLVHRLDKQTSGLMVFAKTSKAARRLSESIKTGDFHKSYLAILHGYVLENGVLKDYLQKIGNKSIVTNKENGKYAELAYQRLAYLKTEDLSLVKVDLKTGRNHQIRLQFKNIGHPLYGDLKYGNDGNKTLGLYAYKLEFPHPTKKEILSFTNYPNSLPFKKFKNLN